MAEKRILGVLAGRDMPREQLAAWARGAEVVIAADGGANLLIEAGIDPQTLVGDMDGVRAEVRDRIGDVHVEQAQDSTDCDKLLRLAATTYPNNPVTLASIEGDLPDHFLATLHSAAKATIPVRFALRRGIGWLLKDGGTMNIQTVAGRRVSLIPLTDCYGIDFEGVRWPLRIAKLHPQEQTSISNEAMRPVVMARVRRGACFLFAEYPQEEMPIW